MGVERLRKKLKQKQVADDLGITKQQLNAIEKSRRTVSPELALKIANYYSKPVEEFFLPTRFETRSLKNE
ncbi:transcriptional regulator [Bacillus pseudomycoides]|nr:transcriptional regulator [Bacillus pseudomycoides]